jgi:hypothetical protein
MCQYKQWYCNDCGKDTTIRLISRCNNKMKGKSCKIKVDTVPEISQWICSRKGPVIR